MDPPRLTRGRLGGLLVCVFAGGVLWLLATGLREESEARTARPIGRLPANAVRSAGRPAADLAAARPGAPARDRDASASPSDAERAPASAEASSVGGKVVPAATEGKTLSEAEILAGIARGEPGYEVLAARLPEKRERLAPRWTAGDTWTVETYYRQMQAAREVWAGPQRWTFRVEGETSFRDRPCFEITAVREDEVDATPTTYYVTRESHRLAGVHTTVAEQGKKRAITYLPDSDGDDRTPVAVKAPFAVAPFDLPPLDADARVVPPGLGDAAPLLASPEERARYPRPEALLGASGEHLEIEYASPIDRTTVFQRWSRKDLRWPVLSRTETTLSFRR